VYPGRFPVCWRLLAVNLAMWLSACSGGGDAVTSSSAAAVATAQAAGQVSSAERPVSQSDSTIAALLYSDTQRIPAGFNTETVPVFSGYVATAHLKNSDLNANANTQYELCSDDFNQALQWSETANSTSGVNANLVGNDATARYFEFDRVRAGTPQGYLRTRVYKCAYVDRSSVDLHMTQGAAGVVNVRPLDTSALQGLSEYLWQFTAYNNFGNVVLNSSGASNSVGLTHSLIIATLTAATSANACDTINVLEWKHSVNQSSGALTLSVTQLWSFHAQQSNGAVSVCAN
jgi:hypothetical protein